MFDSLQTQEHIAPDSFINNTAWKYLRKVLTSRFTFSTNSEAKNIAQRMDRTEKIRQGPA